MRIEIDDNFIELLPVNLRQFRLYTDSEDVLIKYDDKNYIDTIIINDSFIIKVGKEIEVDGFKYMVNLIRKENNYYYCIQERATKTSQFVMPILGGSYSYYDFKNTFYNAYISADYQFLYLMYKFSPSEEYLELEGKLTVHALFEELIDPNPNTVVFKFKIPNEYYPDIKKIMKGKYSDITPTLKSKICIFHGFGVTTKTFRMLHRDVTLRQEMSVEYGFNIPEDIELMSKPVIDKEIYDINKILRAEVVRETTTLP